MEDFEGNKITFALLFKRSNENLTGNIDEVVLQMVYGNSRKPPGDEKSPAQKLRKVWQKGGKLKNYDEVEIGEEPDEEFLESVVLGIWAPPNSLSKAMVLKLLFPNISGPFRLVDLKPVPLCLAVAYDAYKAKEVLEMSERYPGKVTSFGYFSSDMPGEAKLLGKTTEKFEARNATVTYEEKIVIQLVKDEDEKCYTDFMDIGPSYVSTDVDVGELDCRYFFPPDYNTPEAEIITFLKKKTKRKARFGKFKIQPDQLLDTDTQSAITGTEPDTSVADLNGEQVGEENGEETVIGDDANNEEGESEDEGDENEKDDENEKSNEEVVDNADKATSPVAEN